VNGRIGEWENRGMGVLGRGERENRRVRDGESGRKGESTSRRISPIRPVSISPIQISHNNNSRRE